MITSDIPESQARKDPAVGGAGAAVALQLMAYLKRHARADFPGFSGKHIRCLDTPL
jgi:hypothetical protein